MLGSHNSYLTIPESQFKIEALLRFDWEKDEVDLRAAFNMIKGHWRFKIWGLDIDLRSFSETEIGSTYQELMSWIIKKYGEKVGKPTASIWVDHTPSNIRYAATLAGLFPESKMIHLIRDGRAVASSVIPLDWGPNTIVEAAHWWVEKVAYGLAAESSLERNQIIRIRYEDLIEDPKTTLKTLCSSLEIEYQPQMIKATGMMRVSRYTSGQHALIGKRPDKNRLNAWQRELTPRQIEIFESLTGDFLRYLGYSLKYGMKAKKITRRERAISEIRELCRQQIINKFRYRNRFRKLLS